MEHVSTALRALDLFFQMSTVTDDSLVGGHENPLVTQKKSMLHSLTYYKLTCLDQMI